MENAEVVVCALLYGHYHDLHKRLLDGLEEHVPPETQVWLWANQLCQPSYDYAAQLHSNFRIVRVSAKNTPKYIAMREMFAPIKSSEQWKWVVWFDDDTHVTAPDWFHQTKHFIEQKAAENICYVGEPWFVHHLPGQAEFIKRATWYKGKAFEMIRGQPGINFAQGAYWWLRADVLKLLDWPDPRLSHNGGDTLLGEAVRQQGFPFHRFKYGVRINDAKRRGLNEAPAGARDVNARR